MHVQRALPSDCALCGVRCSAARLCPGCDAALPRLPASRCRVCALPLGSGDLCGRCLKALPHYDSVAAAFEYAFPLDALIQKYKYGPDIALAPVLGSLLTRTPCTDVEAVIPMPLARARLRHRGFNQAQEMARLAARACGIPVLRHACRKVSETAPQAGLPFDQRARNVRGSFVCDDDLTGRRVAIVDDVMTTGASVNELARVLKHAGAQAVRVWVLARTVPFTIA
jgi:ComF family protein